MPEANQYTLTHKEIVTLILKEVGIHEGRWMLLVNFGMAPGNYGATEDQSSPGMILVVSNLGIQREAADSKAPSSLVVDAAEVNPAPIKPQKTKAR